VGLVIDFVSSLYSFDFVNYLMLPDCHKVISVVLFMLLEV